MKEPYYISPLSNNDKLFRNLKIGDHVEFSLIYKKTEIRKMFERYNISFIFCLAGSQEYRQFGSVVIKITGINIPDVKQIKPAMFDPKMLAI